MSCIACGCFVSSIMSYRTTIECCRVRVLNARNIFNFMSQNITARMTEREAEWRNSEKWKAKKKNRQKKGHEKKTELEK